MRLLHKNIAIILVLAAAWGCEHAPPFEPPAGGVQPTLSSIQTSIFDTRCAFSPCHAGAGAPLALDLTDGKSFANLVDQASGQSGFTRVIPDNPDDSYLVMKLEGDPRIANERMPLNAEPLSVDEIKVIRDWIANGAPND